MRISDWSSDVCSSDLRPGCGVDFRHPRKGGLDMSQGVTAKTEAISVPDGAHSFASDWSSDRKVFKRVPWGKAMMWIFLLSDTFIFSCFLTSYMTMRASTTVPWPNASEVFALTIAGQRSEEHTSELQSLMRISYAVFCLKKKKTQQVIQTMHGNQD